MNALRRLALALASSLSLACALPAAAAGVSADEIVVGTVSDLSGPIAMLGVPVRDGMLMRFDEANAAYEWAMGQYSAEGTRAEGACAHSSRQQRRSSVLHSAGRKYWASS